MTNLRFRIISGCLLTLGLSTSILAEDSASDLHNFSYPKTDNSGKPALLVKGEFSGDHLNVSVIDTVRGDLNNDKKSDGVVIVLEDTGGSGNFRFLCTFLNDGKNLVCSSCVLLGDRIKITDLTIKNKSIVVNYLDRAPQESFALPVHIKKQRVYQVKQGKLILIDETVRDAIK